MYLLDGKDLSKLGIFLNWDRCHGQLEELNFTQLTLFVFVEVLLDVFISGLGFNLKGVHFTLNSAHTSVWIDKGVVQIWKDLLLVEVLNTFGCCFLEINCFKSRF